MLLLSGAAHAAGLGKLTVLSHLGEPLRAEIDVVAVEKGEVETLSARLASPDAYIQSNLPYPSPALGLKITVDTRPSGAPYIRATSAQAIAEPFVDLLVELNWTGGKILRAYTALLDPPAFAAASPATPAPGPEAGRAELPPAPSPAPPVETRLGSEMQPQTPAPPPAEVAAEPPSGDITAEPAPLPPAEAPAASEPTMQLKPEEPTVAQRETYGPVKRGDNLTKIAKEFQSPDVTLEQLLVLLYRNNKDAFAGNNMNRLKTGKVLTVPDATDADVISVKEARKEVRVQVANYNAYRERLAATAGDVADSTESGPAATGRVTGPVTDKGARGSGEPKEVLKLSKGEAPGTGSKAAQDKVRGLEEEVAARDRTIRDANERIAKLEKTVKDMQSLIELKNKTMADAQKPGMTPDVAKPAPSTLAPATPAPPTIPAPSTSVAPATPSTGPATAPSPGPTADFSTPSATSPAPTPSPTPKPRPKIVAPPPPAPTMLEQVMAEPWYLAAGVGVILLLAWLVYRWSQSRRSFDDDELVAEKKTSDVGAFSATSTDTAGAMAAASRAAQAQIAEEVDPLAEAEIYLAYGRDGQAEEILKEALQNHPRRPEIQIKLLEIYAKRKDIAAFDTVARELQANTGGKGELWLQAARLGYQIDPANPRYLAGKPTGAEAAAAAAAAAASTDKTLDFQVDALEPSSPEMGTLTDIDAGFGRRFAATATATGAHERVDLNVSIDDGQSAGTKTDFDLGRLGSSETNSVDLNLDRIGAAPRPATSTDIDFETMSRADRTTQIAPMDFNLDLPEEGEDQTNSQFTKADSVDFDFRLDDTQSGVAHGEDSGLDFDIDKISLETGPTSGKSEPVLDLGHSAPPMPEIDLSSINLDLGSVPGESSQAGGPRDDKWYDVQTKFDLAKAYQEMGDREGAREILREVMVEGDAEQKAAAEKVLETLS